jgi:hypothetical protein
MRTLTPRALDPADYATWFDANRADLAYRSAYHDPGWLTASTTGVGFEEAHIGLWDGGEMVAAVPGHLTRRGPFRLFGSPLRGTMTSSLGPVSLDPNLLDGQGRTETIDTCARFARETWGVRYVRVTTQDEPARPQPLPDGPGWHGQGSGSYRKDLTPGEEAVFASLKSRCRRNVRKAGREGLTIEENDDPALFFDILQETFRHHGTTSYQRLAFFEGLLATLPARDRLWSWGAHHEGQVIAVGLFLHDDREMHFVSGASRPGFGSLPTSYLLHWHAIATACRHGLEVFHSEESKIPSIDHFKETFTPVLERRGTLIWAPRLAWSGQRAYRRVHRRVSSLKSRLPVG